MVGEIIMGMAFVYSFAGCVVLYAIATAEAEPSYKPDNLLSGCLFMVLLFKPEIDNEN